MVKTGFVPRGVTLELLARQEDVSCEEFLRAWEIRREVQPQKHKPLLADDPCLHNVIDGCGDI